MLVGVERPFYLQCLIFCETLREDVVVEMETGGGCSLHMHEVGVDFSGNRSVMLQKTGQARRTGRSWVIYWKKMVIESSIKVEYDMMLGDDGNDGNMRCSLSLSLSLTLMVKRRQMRSGNGAATANATATATASGTFLFGGEVVGAT